MAKKSTDEEALALDLRAEKLEGWEREYRFGAMAAGGPARPACPAGPGRTEGLAVRFCPPGAGHRCRGRGRRMDRWAGHTRGAGFEEDLRKYDAAMRLGWTVYRCSPAMVRQGVAIDTIKRLILAAEGNW